MMMLIVTQKYNNENNIYINSYYNRDNYEK